MVKKHFVIPKRQRELEKFFLANQKAFAKALNTIRKREKQKKKTTKRGRGGSKISDIATSLGSFGAMQYLKHYGSKDAYERARPQLKYNMRIPTVTSINVNKFHSDQQKWGRRQNKYFNE